MNSKPRNSLLLKKQSSDVVSFLVLQIKENFKNLDLDLHVRDDPELVVFLMGAINEICSDTSTVDKKIKERIDKTELLIQVVGCVWPDLTEDELERIKQLITFASENKMVKKKRFQKFFSRLGKCLVSFLIR